MEILTLLQKKFLSQFFKSYLGQKFYLTGGTALTAFYLKHRKSEDLDLFTNDQNLSFDAVAAEVNKIAQTLKLKIDHQVSTPSFLQYIFKHQNSTLKVDLVKDVPLHFGKITKTPLASIDSLENIAVGKLLAAFGRADPKDFIDLYFLFKKRGIFFAEIFKLAQKKDLGLNEFYLAGMFSRVQEIKFFPKTFLPLDKKELINFFLELSRELFQKIKPSS